LETRPLGLALFKSAVTRSESEYLQDNPEIRIAIAWSMPPKPCSIRISIAWFIGLSSALSFISVPFFLLEIKNY
jgi:hypothetical protein